MTTAMVHSPAESAGTITMYDRVDDPLKFIDQIGTVLAQSGACGCKNPAEGKLVALACLCERKSPFDIARRYHLMDGKLSVKADVMLADLRAAGGSFKWIKDGKDGESAAVELTYKGQTYTSTYSMQDAQRAKLVKANGGWEKNPANMLRARAISDGIRMIAPEIAAGVYTPEETEDIINDGAAPVTATATPAATGGGRKARSAADAEARKKELQQAQTETQPSPAVTQPPIETTATPATATQSAAPAASEAPVATETAAPVAADDSQAKAAELAKIDALCKEIGVSRSQLEAALKGQSPDFKNCESLDLQAMQNLIVNLTKKVEAKKAAAAAAHAAA